MKILVIGGSYFYGRVFVMLAAKEHELTLVNRGTYSMAEFGVREVKGERHDESLWRGLSEQYDAVVDFCAYNPGDVRIVLENLPCAPRQYILISTVDVYERGSGERKGEEAPYETRSFPGEAGAYIAGKVALERELKDLSGVRTAYTILRPAILYGPYNYAPRESAFIRMAVREHCLPAFTDADGRFQFVYVKDAAQAILNCLGNEETYAQAYNLCGEETLDYCLFFETLRELADQALDGGCRTLPMSLAEAQALGVPVPFPATAAETELVSNRKSREELSLSYTPLGEGMQKTFTAFRHVYE